MSSDSVFKIKNYLLINTYRNPTEVNSLPNLRDYQVDIVERLLNSYLSYTLAINDFVDL